MTLRYHVPLDLGKDKFAVAQKFHNLVETRQFTKGEAADDLASKIANYTSYDYAIPFGQGTHAIFILARWYRKLGYRRICAPAFTWPSTYLPFEWCGYRVRFVDINSETWLADFGDIPPQTDELDIPVDTFGSVYPHIGWDEDRFVDSAQSLGASWPHPEDGMPNRIVSLSGSKIVTSGEGGMLLTQDKELRDFAYSHSWFSRMNEMEAILGLAYFDKLNEILEKKKEIAEAYRKVFPQVQWQVIPHSTNNYIVAGLVDAPMNVILANSGVEFRRYYDTAINESNERTPMADLDGLPNTKSVAQRILAFPSWPEMPLERIKEIRI